MTTVTYENDPDKRILGKVTQETVDHPTGSGVDTWTTTRSFDNAGNLTSRTRYGVQTSYTYTADGDVEKARKKARTPINGLDSAAVAA